MANRLEKWIGNTIYPDIVFQVDDNQNKINLILPFTSPDIWEKNEQIYDRNIHWFRVRKTLGEPTKRTNFDYTDILYDVRYQAGKYELIFLFKETPKGGATRSSRKLVPYRLS